MTSSISSTSDDAIQLMMQQMMQKMSAADTDGSKGLSMDELSSIDTSGDAGGAAFLKSLQEQFKALDSDGDGQLASEEISNAKPPEGPMGPPPGLTFDPIDGYVSATDDLENTAENADDSADSSAAEGAASEQFMKEIMESFITSFAENFGETDSDSEEKKNLQEAVNRVIGKADANGDGSLSMDEISSYNQTNSSDLSKDLMGNFKSYDTNGDSVLSQDELAAVIDKQPNSPELKFASVMGDKAGDFFQKLINNYGNLSDLTSSLSVSV